MGFTNLITALEKCATMAAMVSYHCKHKSPS